MLLIQIPYHAMLEKLISTFCSENRVKGWASKARTSVLLLQFLHEGKDCPKTNAAVIECVLLTCRFVVGDPEGEYK